MRLEFSILVSKTIQVTGVACSFTFLSTDLCIKHIKTCCDRKIIGDEVVTTLITFL